jgi:hypothetical protein
LLIENGYLYLIEFINNNEGCTIEQVVEGLKENFSRVPIYQKLKILLKEGVVKDESTNRRDRRLYVDKNNPSVSIPQQLRDIEKRFKNLLNKSEIQLQNTPAKDFDIDYIIELLEVGGLRSYFVHLMILQLIADSVIIHSTTIWINKFRDKDALDRLYAYVYTKLASLNSHYLSYLSNIQHGYLERIRFDGSAVCRVLSPIQLMYVSRSVYKEIGMQGEVEAVFDSLWIFNKDVQKFLFPEIKHYKWDFKYESDDWRKLLEIYENNPDQTAHNFYLQ